MTRKRNNNNAVALRADPVTGLPIDIFPGNYGPKERSMIAAVSERYGFDPIGKEVEIIHGQLYVTSKGIARVAVSDPSFDGIEIEVLHEDWEKGFFVVKAKVWKKGCAHPIEDIADSDGSRMAGGNRFRHTITRAKSRALRSAFAIPFCAVEELSDSDRYQHLETRPVRRDPPVKMLREMRGEHGEECPECGENPCHCEDPNNLERKDERPPLEVRRVAELRRLHAIGREDGFSHDNLRALLGAESLADLQPDRLAQFSGAYSEWTETEVERARNLIDAESLEELRSAWEEIQNGQRRLLAPAKDLRKQALS